MSISELFQFNSWKKIWRDWWLNLIFTMFYEIHLPVKYKYFNYFFKSKISLDIPLLQYYKKARLMALSRQYPQWFDVGNHTGTRDSGSVKSLHVSRPGSAPSSPPLSRSSTPLENDSDSEQDSIDDVGERHELGLPHSLWNPVLDNDWQHDGFNMTLIIDNKLMIHFKFDIISSVFLYDNVT